MNPWPALSCPIRSAKRAAGRKKYQDALRALRAERRAQVARLLASFAEGLNGVPRGAQARIAELLNCSRATICKDVRHLMELAGRAVGMAE
jgi:hypothetical protein